MTQEEKQLLLKDLCARLPYGVMIEGLEHPEVMTIKHLAIIGVMTVEPYKPYLRPMSSMTEEEKEEAKTNGCIIYHDTSPKNRGLMVIASPKGFDWLNKKMFDYRGLIEKGLALEAPEVMYKHFGDMDVVVTSVEHKDKL